MHLQLLAVQRLRILREIELALGPGLNVFTGPNGSGKTSVLEAVHILGTGRSFRATSAAEIVTRGEPAYLCRGTVVDSEGSSTQIGVENGKSAARVRCNGETISSASSLARVLPLVLISPESQRLLTDGSELRRGIVDWALFHVEHSYGDLHRRYRRVLRQRNASLKQGLAADVRAVWEDELVQLGEAVQASREAYLAESLPVLSTFVAELLERPVEVVFRRGWSEEVGLGQALRAAETHDSLRGFTSVGPHRADLIFKVDGVRAHRVFSRGEGKLFVLAILLSQVRLLTALRHSRCTVLLDELASELDDHSRSKVFRCLSELGCQTLLTAVSPQLIEQAPESGAKMFHVEQGVVREVVQSAV